MFFKIGQQYFNSNHITSILRCSHGKYRLYVTDKDNSYHDVEIDEMLLDHFLGTIIPAAPGWRVVKVADNGEVYMDDILAFSIGVAQELVNCVPVPITAADGIPSDNSEWAIVSPDGKIEWQFVGTYQSTNEFSQAVIEARRKNGLYIKLT